MEVFTQWLAEHPEVVLFFSLAFGVALGRIKLFGFSLGNAAGVLLVSAVLSSMLAGEDGFALSSQIKTLAFALFVFAVGYRGGPEFFASLGLGTLKQAVVTLVIATTGLSTAMLLSWYFKLDIGTTLGLAAGGMTQTAMLGTGYGALASLPISPDELTLMEGNAAVAYALTYILGTVGVVLFCSQIGPRLLGVDLAEDARRYDAQNVEDETIGLSLRPVERRVYKVLRMAGTTVGELEAMLPGRASCERIKRGNAWVETVDRVVLQQGDLLLMVGRREALIQARRLVGREVQEPELLGATLETIELVFSNHDFHNLAVHEIAVRAGEMARGVFLEGVTRAGREIPLHPDLVLLNGDVLKLSGLPEDVSRIQAVVGPLVSRDERTDLVWLGLGLGLGTLLGLAAVTIGGVAVTLGSGGGALVAGLVIGWWNARSPRHAAMPAPAGRVLWDLGLALFCAVVGLSAGPQAYAALQSTGLLVLGCGALVTFIPLIVGLFFGRFVLGLPTIILVGSLAGSQTQDAAMLAASDVAGSTLPVLGFTVPYAIANVLLTALGPLVVILLY